MLMGQEDMRIMRKDVTKNSEAIKSVKKSINNIEAKVDKHTKEIKGIKESLNQTENKLRSVVLQTIKDLANVALNAIDVGTGMWAKPVTAIMKAIVNKIIVWIDGAIA